MDLDGTQHTGSIKAADLAHYGPYPDVVTVVFCPKHRGPLAVDDGAISYFCRPCAMNIPRGRLVFVRYENTDTKSEPSSGLDNQGDRAGIV
jgi:hypothetical protein